ncbi:WD40 repeat protein [Streptomyces glaucescens]
MNPVGEPTEDGEEARFHAEASGHARIYQAGRDLHLRYEAGIRRARRVESGAGPGECPYPGLSAFDAGQARWFFGRDAMTADLLVRLDERLRDGGALAVVAPSGAGKSSLLRAGLVPALARGALPVVGSARWPLKVFTPTGSPVRALMTHLAEVTNNSPERVREALRGGPAQCVALVREALRCRSEGGSAVHRRLVLVVDQLEELFTLCAEEHERRRFLRLLTALAARGDEDTPPVALVVYGLRSDFYGQCANYPELRATLQNHQVLVGPLSQDGLREAIQYPADDVGLEIEPGLVELLLRDLGVTAQGQPSSRLAGDNGSGSYEAGRLPLLAHALRATWQQNGNILTVDGYQATGGIHHAIATTAETCYDKLDPLGQQAARSVFLRLVRIGDGVDDTRRRVPHADLLSASGDPALSAAVINTFIEGRLLTPGRDTVEITHEALLYAWPRLRQWIDADRAGNLIRQELEETAVGWDRNRRDPGLLYRGSRLEAARTWAATGEGSALGPAAAEFLAASVRQERRAARRRRSAIVVLSVLALIASGTAIVAFQQRESAIAQRATARSERDTAIFLRTTAEAEAVRSSDPSLAAQLDLVAYRMRPTVDGFTRLVNDAQRTLSMPLKHSHRVASAVISPDGKTLASADYGGKVRLWNLADPMHPRVLGTPLTDDRFPVFSVVFSQNGKLLAAAGGDKLVRVWDVSNPARPQTLGALPGHTEAVGFLAFSPDGKALASAGNDRTIRLWNLADPARVVPRGKPLTGHSDVVNSLEFSADGRTLASASDDRTVRLWNVAGSGRPAPLGEPLADQDGAVWTVAFSPDGQTLVSAGMGQEVHLWDLADLTHPKPRGSPLPGHTDIVSSVTFSRDGRTLASASHDGTVRLWNLDPVRPVPLGEPLTGHDGPVSSVTFAPDGYTLASSGLDGTVRLWSRPRTLLTGHVGHVYSVAFSPRGRILASAGNDGTIRLWDTSDPARPVPLGEQLRGHDGRPVASVAFSPDGRILASAGYDKTVRLWDFSDPTHPEPLGKPLLGHTDFATFVVFSPNGRTLASASEDGTVRLWNLADASQAKPLGEPITGHTDGVWTAAFSPNGRILATGSNDISVRLWDVSNPSRIKQLGERRTTHAAPVGSVAFSPDGKTLASGGANQQVQLWNVTDPSRQKNLVALPGFTDSVSSVLFNSNGKRLVAASEDATLRLWNSSDPTTPLRMGEPLTGHLAPVSSLGSSPDEEILASGSYDFTVRLWGMKPEPLIKQICQATSNVLTREQWKEYIPQRPFDPPCI